MTNFNPADLIYVLPFLVLAGTGIMLVLAEAFFVGRDRTALAGLTVASALVALVASVLLYRHLGVNEARGVFSDMLIADRFGYVLSGLFSFLAILVALMAPGHQRAHGWEVGEFYGVLLLSTAGMAILSQASNLVSIFLGIETMSIGVYAMTGMRRRSRRSNEAAMKYFLMGAFATGFLVYGLALLYGATGTTSLIEMPGALAVTKNVALVVVGVFMLVVAFGFKIAAVPFHMWAPDAYEGAPTPVTAYMSAAVKAAAIAAMIRLFGVALGGDVIPFGTLGWASPFAVIAAITIMLGSIAAVRQDNVKRMLAYSSVSHGGVLLVGLCAMGLGSAAADSAIVYYLIAYSITSVGALAVVCYVGLRGDRERTLVDDWAGLGSRHPAAALAMTILLLSLGGMPPTAGFFAKFYLFKSAMEVYGGQLLWLVVIGVFSSAISIYYYLRIVTAMYFRDSTEPFTPARSAGGTFVMALCAVLVLAIGLMPGFWLRLVGLQVG